MSHFYWNGYIYSKSFINSVAKAVAISFLFIFQLIKHTYEQSERNNQKVVGAWKALPYDQHL